MDERNSMYRLIIADDEFTIRNGLTRMIRWDSIGYDGGGYRVRSVGKAVYKDKRKKYEKGK